MTAKGFREEVEKDIQTRAAYLKEIESQRSLQSVIVKMGSKRWGESKANYTALKR